MMRRCLAATLLPLAMGCSSRVTTDAVVDPASSVIVPAAPGAKSLMSSRSLAAPESTARGAAVGTGDGAAGAPGQTTKAPSSGVAL